MLVARVLEDLSVEETAALLGCSPGTQDDQDIDTGHIAITVAESADSSTP
ncbi:hypothetical protein [Phytohabitans kaempferiae]|uniref:RNA polymerase sigma factor 70 region 4 type 2 domain-containing protein n=1 Tax=Phytohabitans kaempferiae TaxID=1620943 RepID=A0ABV6MHL9_9ACTN